MAARAEGPVRDGATIVLDTAALMSGLGPAAGAPTGPAEAAEGVDWVAPAGVAEELRPGGPTGRALARAKDAGLRLLVPARPALEEVLGAAQATGDRASLSLVDLQALGIAHALKAEGREGVELWTDDHAMQNVAERLAIPWRPVQGAGIREAVTWHIRCTGCGQWFGTGVPGQECLICGSPLKRTRKAPPKRARGGARGP